MTYSFSYLEPVHCSMSSFNFLTCIQISQEAGQVVWYSHLFQNFPQFAVIYKGFGAINKAEINVFLELSCFFDDPADIGKHPYFLPTPVLIIDNLCNLVIFCLYELPPRCSVAEHNSSASWSSVSPGCSPNTPNEHLFIAARSLFLEFLGNKS